MRLVLSVRDGAVTRYHFDAAGFPDGDHTVTFGQEAFDPAPEYPICDNPAPHEPHAYGSAMENHGGRCPGRSANGSQQYDNEPDDDFDNENVEA